MNKATAERISRLVDKIMENRTRRFKFLIRKERLDDAFAVADEFYEWLHPDFADDDDLIVYYDSEELEALYYQKKVQSLIKEDFEDYGSEEEHY
tara:strand:- start:2222 stop:2503 length:282 start_codon:yes stop_codon:yes gene_type:complete